jgi:hypothetical protein
VLCRIGGCGVVFETVHVVENRRWDRLIGEQGADAEGILEGFADQTDKSDLHFRYAL